LVFGHIDGSNATEGGVTAVISELPEARIRARRRIACRLLPFVFLIYVVNFIDRVNVSFANLRMSADLGFSDRVYGLGVGMFYLTYVLFEITGAIIVERWSARKWIARIMISWGVVTILTGFVHSAGQFYVARFFLGLAEASFFPGMIVYLTHWFSARDRCRAIACLYTAVPTASLPTNYRRSYKQKRKFETTQSRKRSVTVASYCLLLPSSWFSQEPSGTFIGYPPS
jgi:ACS family tartrate transporter-like MFS transporter